jgi:hypothetical protein
MGCNNWCKRTLDPSLVWLHKQAACEQLGNLLLAAPLGVTHQISIKVFCLVGFPTFAELITSRKRKEAIALAGRKLL